MIGDVLNRNGRGPTQTRRLTSGVAVGVFLAIVAVSGLLFFSDARTLAHALDDFNWTLLPLALALTIWNYLLRFFKWQIYLRRLAIRGLPWRISLLVFLSAFAMSITPGKAGELIKCALLKRIADTPASRSTAIVVAERLTDGLAMIVLAAIGAWQFRTGRPVLAVAALVAAAAVLLLSRPARLTHVLDGLPPFPIVGNVGNHLESFFAASGTLVSPPLLAAGTANGVLAWLGECVALFVILVGLGVPATSHLLLISAFVLAVSSLAGALSLLPGGLGVAEASVAGMLLVFVPGPAMNHGVAGAATLLIRFATLWFAVILGVLSLAVLRRTSHFRSSPNLDERGSMTDSARPLVPECVNPRAVSRRSGGNR
jgi:uncharacterized membrane protein YbhN (UPF0104 family)